MKAKAVAALVSWGAAAGMVLAAPGTAVGTTAQASGTAQASATAKVSSGISLQNENSGYCLVARTLTAGTPAVMSTSCGDWPDQKWSLVGSMLRNDHSNLCLTARTGEPAKQHLCMGYTDQTWDFLPAAAGWQIRSRHTGLCLVARGFLDAEPVTQTACDPLDIEQRWLW